MSTITKSLDELAVGDVIIDPQGRAHTVLALAPVTDEDGDRGMRITVAYDSIVSDDVFTQDRDIYPVGEFSSILFHVEVAA